LTNDPVARLVEAPVGVLVVVVLKLDLVEVVDDVVVVVVVVVLPTGGPAHMT
jgi:hypothetical protein